MKLVLKAWHIAESLSIKRIRSSFAGELIDGNSYELFYRLSSGGFVLVLDYGVAVFAGADDVEAGKALEFLKNYCSNELEEPLTEEFTLSDGSERSVFLFNSLQVPELSDRIVRITMLGVGQSAALDHFSKLTQGLLEETSRFTEDLEKKGRLSLSKKQLLMFIGKSMNMKKRIIDSIYILDEPDLTWEDETLSRINAGLRETFDLSTRFRDLDYQMKLVSDNLGLLAELHQHREANFLEWIIIVLFIIEVVDLFAGKLT